MSTTEDEIARLRAGEDPTRPAEDEWPTPGQWIYRFNQMSAERRLAAAKQVVANAQEALACSQMNHLGQISATEGERDGAYRERAHLVAFVASLMPAVIARDPEEPDWPIIYIDTPAGQLFWHISEADMELFAHVPRVEWGDRRAVWDGHTTETKYERLASLISLTKLGNEAAR